MTLDARRPTPDSRLSTPTMTNRIHNFSAGPAVLPEPVLRKAQEAIWNVAGSGIGIMEHSHRGKVFDRIVNEAEEACRSLGGIPDNYRVLFLQGGASLQFAMVPMNLLRPGATASADDLIAYARMHISERAAVPKDIILLTKPIQPSQRMTAAISAGSHS
jgi:phosphoserine aminotransferase